MKSWKNIGVGVAAVVLAVAAAGGAYATWGGDDGDDGEVSQERQDDATGGDVAAVCVEGAEDCVDTIVEGDDGAAGGTCLEGTEDCNDTPGVGLGQCAPGVTDCVDVVVGEADCAPDAECVAPDVQCDAAEGCEAEAECGIAWPEGAPTPTAEEIERAYAACEADKRAAECSDTPEGDEPCLPPDCAVSSNGDVYCPDEGTGSGEGSSEPGSAGGSAPDDGAGVDPAEPSEVEPVQPE